MSHPAPDTGMDLPPAARRVVAAVLAAPTVPTKLLVTGGIGTGKTSVLAAVRGALRDAGRVVLTLSLIHISEPTRLRCIAYG
ncbi:hypothetical protein, partial [Mycobacterium sp. 852013-50091_SCH5140682]|uniref:hypothetical protein n=1 Tax=Mycobacterium sp. 852013-50091_SCH5140682 TaxID=1834109 RepID=UPI0012EA9CD6